MGSYRVYIKNPYSPNNFFETRTKDCSILDVKQKVSAYYSSQPPPNEQHIIFRGKILGDDDCISSLADENSEVVFLLALKKTALASFRETLNLNTPPPSLPRNTASPMHFPHHPPFPNYHSPFLAPPGPPLPGYPFPMAPQYNFHGYPPPPQYNPQGQHTPPVPGGPLLVPLPGPPLAVPPPAPVGPQNRVEDRPNPAQDGGANQQHIRIRRYFNFTLAMKLFVMVMLFSQGDDWANLKTIFLILVAVLMYLHQVGILSAILSKCRENNGNRRPGRRAEDVGVAIDRERQAEREGRENQNGEDDENNEDDEDAELDEEPVQPRGGVFVNMEKFVLGLFASLFPEWRHRQHQD